MLFDISDLSWFLSANIMIFIWLIAVGSFTYFLWSAPPLRFVGLCFGIFGYVNTMFITYDYLDHRATLKRGDFKQVTGIPMQGASSSERTLVFWVDKRFFRCYSDSVKPHASKRDCLKIISSGKQVRISYVSDAMHGHGEGSNLILKVEYVDARN